MSKNLDNLEIYQLAKKTGKVIEKAGGFSFIELLVSLGIIIIVIVVAISIYVYTLGGQQKSTVAANLQQDGQYLLSMIAKDIRNNRVDYNSYTTPISNPVYTLYLVDDSSPTYTYYAYRYNALQSRVENCREKSGSQCQDNDFKPVSMTDVKVSRFEFYIEPVTDPFTSEMTIVTLPRVTSILELYSEKERFGEKRLHLQETVPQRVEEKR